LKIQTRLAATEFRLCADVATENGMFILGLLDYSEF